MTNNVKSCKKINGRVQTFRLSVTINDVCTPPKLRKVLRNSSKLLQPGTGNTQINYQYGFHASPDSDGGFFSLDLSWIPWQVTSDSSIDGYIRALKEGCRCVEVIHHHVEVVHHHVEVLHHHDTSTMC